MTGFVGDRRTDDEGSCPARAGWPLLLTDDPAPLFVSQARLTCRAPELVVRVHEAHRQFEPTVAEGHDHVDRVDPAGGELEVIQRGREDVGSRLDSKF